MVFFEGGSSYRIIPKRDYIEIDFISSKSHDSSIYSTISGYMEWVKFDRYRYVLYILLNKLVIVHHSLSLLILDGLLERFTNMKLSEENYFHGRIINFIHIEFSISY